MAYFARKGETVMAQTRDHRFAVGGI